MDNQQRNNEQLAKMGESVKSITNIYYDCLERIFEFLDLESLLNVANTCKRLQIAAAAYYGDVYGKGHVRLFTSRNLKSNAPGFGYKNGRYCVFVEWELCLPFLRCFGPKILHLMVFCSHRCEEANYVIRYINQYCAKALETILFFKCPDFSIENFPNPFEFVEKVCMLNAELKEQLPHLVKIFPMLRKLDLTHVSVDDNGVAIHFPNLEDLTVKFGIENFTMKNLVDLLHANPQLQKLDLEMTRNQETITMNELLNTISQNPLITKLKLSSSIIINPILITNINPADLMRFASERPHTVELDLPSHRIPPQDAINFIRELKSLKIFRFSFNDQADYDQLVSQLDIEWQHEININETIFNNNTTIIILR